MHDRNLSVKKLVKSFQREQNVVVRRKVAWISDALFTVQSALLILIL